MKGKENAFCTERAAVAQNLLVFLGYDSSFVSGVCIIDGKTEDLSFNVIKTKEGGAIYDPANPVEVKKDDGSEFFAPASYPISAEQYIDLTHKGKTSVIHNDLNLGGGSFTKKADTVRVYSG